MLPASSFSSLSLISTFGSFFVFVTVSQFALQFLSVQKHSSRSPRELMLEASGGSRELLSYFLSRNDSHSSHDVTVKKKKCGNWDINEGTPKRPARHVISLTQLCPLWCQIFGLLLFRFFCLCMALLITSSSFQHIISG